MTTCLFENNQSYYILIYKYSNYNVCYLHIAKFCNTVFWQNQQQNALVFSSHPCHVQLFLECYPWQSCVGDKASLLLSLKFAEMIINDKDQNISGGGGEGAVFYYLVIGQLNKYIKTLFDIDPRNIKQMIYESK